MPSAAAGRDTALRGLRKGVSPQLYVVQRLKQAELVPQRELRVLGHHLPAAGLVGLDPGGVKPIASMEFV
jgi:hypothetical protein